MAINQFCHRTDCRVDSKNTFSIIAGFAKELASERVRVGVVAGPIDRLF